MSLQISYVFCLLKEALRLALPRPPLYPNLVLASLTFQFENFPCEW